MTCVSRAHLAKDMEDLFEKFTVSILKLNKLVQRIKACEMKKFGLKSVHAMCLYHLSVHGQGLSAGRLVKLTLEDKAAISRALSDMRKMGYVEYDASRHGAPVKLTRSGAELAESIRARAAAAVGAGSLKFTPDQREFFYRSLITISDNLQNYYEGLTHENTDETELK